MITHPYLNITIDPTTGVWITRMLPATGYCAVHDCPMVAEMRSGVWWFVHPTPDGGECTAKRRETQSTPAPRWQAKS